MNKITTLALLIVLFVSTASANVWINEESISVTPSDPQVGEEVTVSFSAGTTDLRVEEMGVRFPGGDWQMRDCNLTSCGEEEVGTWTYTPSSSGDKEVEFRATSSNFLTGEATAREPITVQSSSSGASVIWENHPPLSSSNEKPKFGEEYDFRIQGDSNSANIVGLEIRRYYWGGPSQGYVLADTYSQGCRSAWVLPVASCEFTQPITVDSSDNTLQRFTAEVDLQFTDQDPTNSITVEYEESGPFYSNFSYSSQNPEEGETVYFDAACDSSSDTNCARGSNIESYEWDLDGDGNYDDATSFSTSESFQSNTEVGLKITSASGETSTKRKTVNVEEGPFYANFSYSPQEPDPGESVTFDAACDSSSDTNCARGQSIQSYEWDFDGDGDYDDANGFSTSESFDSDTEVGLKVTDAGGETRTKTKSINVGEVTAGFSYSPQDPESGESVTFDASCSSSSDTDCARGQDIESYEWDLDGDGDYDDSTTYSTIRSFQSDTEVGLKITTATGITRTASRTVNVDDQQPSCEEFTDSDLDPSLENFESIPVEGNSYDASGEITNNGDESVSGNFGIYIKQSNEVANCEFYNDHYEDLIGFTGGDVSPSSGESDSFSFSYSGNPLDDIQYGETHFLVGIYSTESTTYIGSVGAIEWQRSEDEGTEPVADFTFDDPVTAGNSVTFDASSSTDPDGDLESYEWDFDDDGDYDDGSTFSASHTFDSSGTYDVALRVTDAEGNRDTVEHNVDVVSEDDNEPVAGFTWDDHPAVVGNSVTFDGSATTDEDGDVETYEWDFDGDGNYDDGSSFSATHTFDSSGSYDVGLRVTDSNDNTDTVDHDVEVVEAPGQCAISVGSLTLEETVIGYGESTQASIQVNNNGDAQDFTVKFKIDGDTVETRGREISEDSSSTFTAPVSPTQDGYINAEVITEGDPCGDNSYSSYRSITVVPTDDGDDGDDGDNGDTSVSPDVSFSWDPSQPGPDSTVAFDASSTTDPQNDIDQYKWFFGDGSAPAYGETVEHTYSDTGDYDVQLVVNDTEGNSGSRTRTVPVRYDPEACSVQVSSLNLGDSYIGYGDSTSASVTVSNLGERQEFMVKFKVSGDVVENRDVVIEANSQRTLSKMVSPTQDSYVTAEITTNSPPCDYEQWTRFKQVLVIPGAETGGEQESTLDVNVQNSNGRRLSNARISVERPSEDNLVRYTGSSGNANFGLSEGTFDVATSKSDYSSDFRSVSLDSGEHRTITVTLDRREEDIGSLIALVEDGEGNRLQNADIRITDTDETRITDSDGRTSINLEAGTYTVRAEKSGYGERTKTVEIDEGQDTTKVFRLGDKDLEITNVNYPSSVCRGSKLTAEATIENSGELHQFISLTGSGLGSINAVNSFSLESGSTVTKTLHFTNVQGSGSEEFKVTVSNQDSDQVERTVQVNECPTPATQIPSDISLTVGYTRSPQMAVAGDIVKVDGFVDGVNGRSTVDILIDDEVKATVNTNPGGFYETWITAQDVGPHTIKARAGEATDTKPLRIIPTSKVTAIEAPVSVFESQEYQICGQVDSQIEPEVALIRDGSVVTSKRAKGEVCFNREARDPGTHKYEIAALTSGEGKKASTTVEVLEMDVEASSFPNQIASVESGSGMVKVELYNNNDDQKQYNLRLEGLPSTWVAQTEKSVILGKGERETVYFYLTPQEEGSYRPTIRVNSGNSQVYEEELDLITGGTTESQPRKDGFFNNIVEGLSDLFAF